MSCDCCKKEKALEKLMRLEPEKTSQLLAFIDSLPLGQDIDANRGHLIETLHKAQGIFGYLPQEVQQVISERLKITRSEIYGVISFYSYFTDKPIGRHKISVCCGTACFVKGSMRIVDEFKKQLNVQEGETTADLKFFLNVLRCVGACSLAPVVMVDDQVYGKVTPEKVSEILAKYQD
ncbi:MAG TPA: NAD(P)H-dependent oxidoreductase subunit E [Lentisphaeria bacterium]|nr:NAD(P)H-dependent oxidoreductase subunit E [Lentisphaeria bacterium]